MKTRTKSKPVHIRESCVCGGSPAADGSPIIRRVKVLGKTSKNKRRYTPGAIAGAVSLYEGAIVYFDHRTRVKDGQPQPDRPFISKLGVLENVRVEEGELFADLRYNPKHLYAPTLEGWVQHDPSQVGFSHDALCRRSFDADGTMVIEEIVEVNSVDLVADPASTEGLFESLTQTKEGSAMDPELNAAGGDVVGGDETAATLMEHIQELAKHIVGDESIDTSAKLKKLKAVLKMLEDDSASEKEEVVEEEECDDYEKAEESVRHGKATPAQSKLVLARLEEARLVESARKTRIAAKKMCVDAKLPDKAITDLFLDNLTEARNDNARASMIADRKSVLQISKTPVSQSGTNDNGRKKLTTDDFIFAK